MQPKTIRRSVFQQSTNDERPDPSLEDQGFLHIMEKEMYQDETNSWVAPQPFRLPRQIAGAICKATIRIRPTFGRELGVLIPPLHWCLPPTEARQH